MWVSSIQCWEQKQKEVDWNGKHFIFSQRPSVPLRIVFGKQVPAITRCSVGYVNNSHWVQTNGFDRLGRGESGWGSINNWWCARRLSEWNIFVNCNLPSSRLAHCWFCLRIIPTYFPNTRQPASPQQMGAELWRHKGWLEQCRALGARHPFVTSCTPEKIWC